MLREGCENKFKHFIKGITDFLLLSKKEINCFGQCLRYGTAEKGILISAFGLGVFNFEAVGAMKYLGTCEKNGSV